MQTILSSLHFILNLDLKLITAEPYVSHAIGKPILGQIIKNDMENRKIAFRAWDTEKKCMITGQWIWYIGFDGRVWAHDKPVDNIVLMQFTGLKDKNGVDIYEGDIIETVLGSALENPTMTVSKVEMSEMGYWVFDESYALGICWDSDKKCFDGIVLGNIYQNPELLK